MALVMFGGPAAAQEEPEPDPTTTTSSSTTTTTTTTAPPAEVEPAAPAPDVGALAVCLVTNGNNAGGGSFRQAINTADANGCTVGADQVVTFTFTGTVDLDSQVTYNNTAPLIINGNGATIDGDDAFRLFRTAGVVPLVTINSTVFTDGNGSGADGGAVRTRGPLVLNGCTFRSNTSDEDGGAVATADEDITINGGTFDDNEAGSGGHVFVGTATATVTGNASFSNGDADGNGGALYANRVLIDRAGFIDNEAGSNGGAIYIDGDTGLLSSITLSDFTHNITDQQGGALVMDDDDPLTVGASRFENNEADIDGGALHGEEQGDMAVTSSTFLGNDALGGDGGALYQEEGGDTTVATSTFTGNTADDDGGAIRVQETVTITSSTFNLNTAADAGGAILAADGVGIANVTNSTVTNNTAGGVAGGILGDNANLAYVTLVDNEGGSENLFIEPGGTFQVFASVIALPVSGPNCTLGAGVTVISSGYNYVSDSSCIPTPLATDFIVPSGNPLLAALAGNGGPTQTRLPVSTSPLLNVIPSGACQTGPLGLGITVDQRGVSRPQGLGCDIGAVEVGVVTATVIVAFTG